MNTQLSMNKGLRLLATGAFICCISFAANKQATYAAPVPELDPEIIANSWEEQDGRYASVTLNGREIIKFKESTLTPNAEDCAEEMAAKLDELLKGDKFDPEKLIPGKDGELAAIRHDGATIIKFPADDIVDPAKRSSKPTPIEHSWRIVNIIRGACGVAILPQSFLKLSELAFRDAAYLARNASHFTFSGSASWYGGYFNGRKTADGTIYNEEHMTAAHRSLPLGTRLLVRNRKTGDACVVKVNDRGPYIGNRVIDLSKAAARQLNMVGSGIAMVDCLVLDSK